ncbi:hypothetical protein Fot_41705 [Forsythia ovata]|uniref:Uncharacterized protein n=1 Tax=Forsythia ovata TaxID=205694 RepID=A0ABD1RJ59_9LAMI
MSNRAERFRRRGATGGSEVPPARRLRVSVQSRAGRLKKMGRSRSSCRRNKMGGGAYGSRMAAGGQKWGAERNGSLAKWGPREGRRRAAGFCFAKGSPGGD